jgi:hypothetical protein
MKLKTYQHNQRTVKKDWKIQCKTINWVYLKKENHIKNNKQIIEMIVENEIFKKIVR